VIARARDPERMAGSVPDAPPHAILERLGGGIAINPTLTDLKQGGLRTTSRPLDVALDGPGFLMVRDPRDGLALTRDGRLTLDGSGRLVTTSGGRPVLDDSGDEIMLDRSRPITIFEDGNVSQGNDPVAQIALVDAAARSLRKLSDGLYTTDALNVVARRSGLPPLPPSSAKLVQSALEESAVDPVSELVGVMKSTRSFEAGTNLLRQQDQITRRSLEAFGRFA
jgi:flagellar basal body rod protein FlgG